MRTQALFLVALYCVSVTLGSHCAVITTSTMPLSLQFRGCATEYSTVRLGDTCTLVVWERHIETVDRRLNSRQTFSIVKYNQMV